MKGAIHNGSGNDIFSEDVTATKNDVLSGKRTITNDSDDEITEGTIQRWRTNANHVANCKNNNGFAWDDDSPQNRGRMYVVEIPRGHYIEDFDFAAAPEPYLRAENIRAGKTIGKVQGTIPVVGTSGLAAGRAWFNEQYLFILNIPEGIYESQGQEWAPEIKVPIAKIREVLGVVANKMPIDQVIAGIQGSIPIWYRGTPSGDVVSALNNEGAVYDDQYAGRGRGIIVRIPNEHIIRGANWVFLSSPNLHPHNIRYGINVNGIVGTLIDYGAGRVVFSNATFDNFYFSGVANSNYQGVFYSSTGILQGSIDHNSQYSHFDGIANGGLQVRVGARTRHSTGDFCSGCVMDKSIDLSPFRLLRIGYFLNGRGKYIGGGYSNIKVKAYLAPLASLQGRQVYINEQPVKSFSSMIIKENVHASTNSGGDLPDNGQRFLDISLDGINGQHYIAIGAVAVKANNADSVSGTVIFNHIEFVN